MRWIISVVLAILVLVVACGLWGRKGTSENTFEKDVTACLSSPGAPGLATEFSQKPRGPIILGPMAPSTERNTAFRAVSHEADQGPVLLELNPPLLAEAIHQWPEAAVAFEDVAPDEEEMPEQDEWSTDEVDPAATDAEEETPSDEETETDTPTDEAEEQAGAEEAESEEEAEPTADAGPPLPELSDEMKSLRGAVRNTIAGYFRQPFNTRDNTATDILQVCMAFGCDAEVRRGASSGQKTNAFTCLCWNYPCAGRELLRICDGQMTAGIGYGRQQYPGQFLATLAMSRVPDEYPLRVGEDVRKVSDLVEYEKQSCRSGEETSFKLIGLTRYLPSDARWQNDLGQTWSLSRLVEEELDRSAQSAPAGGTFRLLALSYAVDRRVKRDEPIDGPLQRAQKYTTNFAKYAMELQNPDGSWHPEFFVFRGRGGTVVDQLYSTGHILRWLVFSLPEDQLRDPQIVRGVSFLTNALATRRYRSHIPSTSAREIAARLGAVHALAIYDERLFAPYDEQKKAEAEREKAQQEKTEKESVAAKTASRS